MRADYDQTLLSRAAAFEGLSESDRELLAAGVKPAKAKTTTGSGGTRNKLTRDNRATLLAHIKSLSKDLTPDEMLEKSQDLGFQVVLGNISGVLKELKGETKGKKKKAG